MKKKNSYSLVVSLLLMLLLTLSGPAMQVSADEGSFAEYTVQRGDNLYKIAGTQLGAGERWSEIYELNKDIIKDPSLIYAGQVLKLPGQAVVDEQKEADKYAQQLYDAASKVEPTVTAVLKSLESDKAHLEGLDFKLKSVESNSRKILSDAHDMEISVEEAAKNIHDSLRYTYVIDDSNYVEMTKQITDTLVQNGCTIYKFKNFWANKDVDYKGINALFVTKDGVMFELQYHTPDSYDTKQNKNHANYEIIRSETTSAEEKAEAAKKQKELFNLVPIPEGAESLTY